MSTPTEQLETVDTPALVLDESRLDRNLERMATRVAGLGLKLRPHVKTAKSVEVARRAVSGHFGGITVSTLREAECFAAAGFDDIVYAVCVSPDKLPRAARLAASGVRVGLITDDESVAAAIVAFAEEQRKLHARHEPLFDVSVEVDVGEHRTGVAPDGDLLPAIAHRLHASRDVRFTGVLAHAGQSYAASGAEQLAAVAEVERSSSVHAADRLAQAGIPCRQVSVGSTPTCSHARSGEGLTEMRPGVYVFGDLFQAEIGACAVDDIALSVLATVISHRRDHNRLVIDAGALALSKDRSTAACARDWGYGRVVTITGAHDAQAMRVTDVHQEHGDVTSDRAIDWQRFPIGSRVRVLPNHACMTAAMYDRYHVVRGSGTEVLRRWPRINGWAPDPHA